MRNREAQEGYAAAHAECLDLVARLQDRLENADAPSDATHWGHVGDMALLAQVLREALREEE